MLLCDGMVLVEGQNMQVHCDGVVGWGNSGIRGRTYMRFFVLALGSLTTSLLPVTPSPFPSHLLPPRFDIFSDDLLLSSLLLHFLLLLLLVAGLLGLLLSLLGLVRLLSSNSSSNSNSTDATDLGRDIGGGVRLSGGDGGGDAIGSVTRRIASDTTADDDTRGRASQAQALVHLHPEAKPVD